MNCRLCDKDLTHKNGLLLFDYNENVETRLGRKINTILNTLERNENLSNFCCEYCSSKIKICFSLLVEIKASDEVIQQTYNRFLNNKKLDTKTQLFNCQECGTTISGIKLFIKHHEGHILKKTIAGSKKDVLLSSVNSIITERKSEGKINRLQKNNGTLTLINSFAVNNELRNNGNCNNTVIQGSCVNDFEDEITENRSSACPEESISDLSDDELNWTSEIKEGSFQEFSKNEDTGQVFDIDSSKEIDLSDAQSDISFGSDSSYINLMQIVKFELEKSDDEETLGVNLEPNEEGQFTCDVCNLTFEYKFILALHLQKDHTAYHEFDVDVQEHEQDFEEVGKESDLFMKCNYCKNSFHKTEFKSHLLECREQYSYNQNTLCQVCGKMCTFQNLEKHMEEHKKLDGWACELCGKKFKAKRFLKSHLGEHDESKKKICEICGKKLLPLSFFSHIIKHREKRHVCQYCGKAFTYNYGLRIHLKVHDANKKPEAKPEKKKDKVFCWLCKKDFSCTIALNKHLKNDHNAEGVEQDSRFPCSQCDKKFADMFSLKAHLKLIHELKDEEIARLKSLPVYRYIECNVCNKVFNSENKIRIHMKQDHGLKPFEMEILKKECEKCGKKFASKQNLIHHINGAHLHIKPMTCDICQEKFAKHSSLIYHKLRHSGEKPFQCEFCRKSYRQRNDVIRHLARHVRDKELTLEEASAVNNSPSRLVIKRRIFLKDSSINYRTIVRKNRRKSEVLEMEPILEEEVNEIQEEHMEFSEDGISDMIYVEEVQMEENQPESPLDVHCMDAKPVYNEERNTIILSNPDPVNNVVKCKYIPSQLKHIPAVIVKKQEQI